eukprot:COSAG01_NODE_51118_length_357_cov_1.007752_1_plen_46_part_01
MLLAAGDAAARAEPQLTGAADHICECANSYKLWLMIRPGSLDASAI